MNKRSKVEKLLNEGWSYKDLDELYDELNFFKGEYIYKQAIHGILVELGLSPAYTGIQYLHDAIEYCLKFGYRNLSIHYDVYPYIAQKYDATIPSIERTIRYAIQNCNTKSPLYIYFCEMRGTDKFTTKTFIYMICDYISSEIG